MPTNLATHVVVEKKKEIYKALVKRGIKIKIKSHHDQWKGANGLAVGVERMLLGRNKATGTEGRGKESGV